MNDDRPSEALALLKSLREVAPKDPDVLAFIGEAHAMQENWLAARQAFDAAFAVERSALLSPATQRAATLRRHTIASPSTILRLAT